MGEKYYKVVFVYPDGHIEEIEETFKEGLEAKEYGNNLLAQVANTEQFHGGLDEEKRNPYFMIVEVKGKKLKLVFESSH